MGNDALLEAMLKELRGETLSDLEALRFMHRNMAYFRYWENVHYQYRHGLYDEVEFQGHLAAIGDYLNSYRSAIALWGVSKHAYSPDFAHDIDRVISERGHQTPD